MASFVKCPLFYLLRKSGQTLIYHEHRTEVPISFWEVEPMASCGIGRDTERLRKASGQQPNITVTSSIMQRDLPSSNAADERRARRNAQQRERRRKKRVERDAQLFEEARLRKNAERRDRRRQGKDRRLRQEHRRRKRALLELRPSRQRRSRQEKAERQRLDRDFHRLVSRQRVLGREEPIKQEQKTHRNGEGDGNM